MADDLQLHQALTPADQAKIKHMDLDSMVRWVVQYALETENDFLSFIFKTGMPGKFPNGKWGFTVVGDSGLHVQPTADKLDHRISMRYAELPRYHVELSSLWGILAPMTIYNEELRLNLLNPETIKAYHLAALTKSIPNYFKYLSWMIFGDTQGKKASKKHLNAYVEKYIEPKDGSNNGYPFYLSDGYGEINLSKVINKQKVKQHALKTHLEQINTKLFKTDIKIEADKAEYIEKKAWLTQNVTEETRKSLALYHKLKQEIEKIRTAGGFESKYRWDPDAFKGFDVPCTLGDLVLILNRQEFIDCVEDFNYTEPGRINPVTENYFGVKVLFTDDIKKGRGLLMHRDLIQAWILPSETRYLTIPYVQEETIDYIYETKHTLDCVPIYSRLWVEVKAG